MSRLECPICHRGLVLTHRRHEENPLATYMTITCNECGRTMEFSTPRYVEDFMPHWIRRWKQIQPKEAVAINIESEEVNGRRS